MESQQRMVSGSGSELSGHIPMNRKLLTSVSWSIVNFRDAIRLLKQDDATMNFESLEFAVAGVKGWLELRISKLQSWLELTHLEFELKFKTHKRFWHFSPPIFHGPTVVELTLPTPKQNAPFELWHKTSWAPGSRWVFAVNSTSIPSCPCESTSACSCQPFAIGCKIFGIAVQPSTDATGATDSHRPQIARRPEVLKERDRLLEELDQEFNKTVSRAMETPPEHVEIHCWDTEYEVNIASFMCFIDCYGMQRKYWQPWNCQSTEDFQRCALEAELNKHRKEEVEKFLYFIEMGLFPELRNNSKKEDLLALAYAFGADVLTKHLLLITTVNDNNVLNILAAALKYPGYKYVQEECFKVLNLKGIKHWFRSSQWCNLKEYHPKGAADVLQALISLETPPSPPVALEEAPVIQPSFSLYTFWSENDSTIKWYLGIVVSLLAVCLLAWWTWHLMKADPELEFEEDTWSKTLFNGGQKQFNGGGRNPHPRRY